MIRTRFSSAMAIAAMAFVSHHSATAQVVFSESFEAPVVSGYSANTVPSNGKWIGSSFDYGSTSRGLYRPNVQWPSPAPFSTPFGEQAFFCNYLNSGLTTAVGVTGQTLTAGVRYQVTFHAAASAGYPTANYRVELVAFASADDNNARKNCSSTRQGAVLAVAGGSVTTTDMSSRFTLSYTPDGANVHLGKDLGIRLMYSGAGSAISVLYDNIRLIAGNDMNPSPGNGQNLKVAGNVTLGWTNMPPVAPSTTTPVDVWFGSNPAALTQVVDGQLVSSKVVSASAAGTWYWRVDSYPDGNANGSPVIGQVFSFTIADTDGDGIPDAWENQYFGGPTAANPSLDIDSDGLTNLQEYTYGSNPIIADTDSDGLLDGVETATNTWVSAANTGTHPLVADTDKDGFRDGVESNTGIWTSAANTGTNPNDPDWDKDGLKDGAETNTGIYVDRFNAGSNPFLVDTDNDGAGDWYEACATFTNPGSAAQTSPIPYPLPKPDGSAGATNKPVKVYIIMGQSNATGMAQVNGTLPGTLETIVKRENRFPNLLDGSNNWLPRNDVLYRRAPVAGPAGPLAPGQGASNGQMGTELGFGQVMGWFHDEPVLILKASQGNRSLGVDFLPPGSTRWDYNGYTYAGYGDSPERWLIGSIPVPGSIYAGRQYDTCFHNLPDYAVPPPSWLTATAYSSGALIGHNGQIYSCLSNHTSDATTEPGVGVSWTSRWANFDSAPEVLAKFGTYYPQWAAQGYEIAGFCWWQGHKDQDGANNPLATKYQENLVNYINAIRDEFNAPNAPFVVATIGFGGEPLSNKEVDFQQVFNAQMSVQDLPQFAGTVKSIDVLKYWRTPAESPANEDFHYNQNAETYMLVGDAMGRAMMEMLPETSPPTPNPPTFAIAPAAVDSTTIGMVATTAVDVSGPVRYYFENLTNSTNSGWITSTRWDSTGLTTGVSYNFRFKAKDANNNETGWSAENSAAPATDTTPPTPMSFTGPLTVLGENSIAMTASPATDINGVSYQFVCTVGGGPNSSWQSSPEFTATGLTPSTSYTYVVRARDSFGNTTADSAPASAATLAIDTTAPTPATMSFATPPTALGTNAITMTATTANDPSSVEYFFEAVSGGTSSGWQNSPTYTDSSLSPGTEYGYRVRARDKSPAQTATGWSAVLAATTEIPDETAPVIAQLSPLNGAINVPVTANLVITFDEEIALGTGSITLKNLTDSTQTTIAITDRGQVSASGAILTINPIANLAYNKNYAVQIDNTAIKDFSENFFGGILNDSTWSFTATTTGPYYWDGNDTTSGFGTAGGTWADPTAGTATSGWSTSSTGVTTVNGSSVSTLTIDAINFGTNTGGFGLSSGTIAVSGTVNSGNITVGTQSGTIVLSGGTINFAPAVTFTMASSTILEIGSLITGAATSITKTGTNSTLRFLNTNNSYTGLTNITGALVVASLADGGLNSSIGASTSAASNLVIGSSGGSLTYTGTTNASTNRLFTLSGGGAINNNGSGTLTFTSTGSVAGAGSLSLGGGYTGGANTFNPRITSGNFAKNDAGTWVLANNANSYTGSTNVAAGTLVIGSIANYGTDSAIGKGTSGTPIFFGSNPGGTGTLVYTGGAQDTDRFIRVGITSSTNTNGAAILNNGTGALNFKGTNFNENFNSTGSATRTITLGGTNDGSISGTIQNGSNTIALTKTGSGTWTLSGTNSYTQATAIQEGNLVAGSNSLSLTNGAFGNASSEINLGVTGGNSNAGLLIGGSFTVARNVRLLTNNTTDTGTRVLTIGGNTADNSEFSGNIFLGTTNNAGRGVTLTAASGGQVTFSGVIQNPSGMDATTYTVTKAGAGTAVLSNTNTYTGATAINQGTLRITGGNQATNSISFTGGSLGLDTGSPVTAASAAVNLANGTISVTGSTGAATYTLLTAASITGTPVLSVPVSGYQLQVIDGANDELRLVQTSSPYDTWSGGVPFGGDANGDGISNGLAFLLGASGPHVNALDKLPTVTQSAGGLTLSFSMLNDTANGNATPAIEYSNSLAGGSWTAVQVPYSSATVNEIVFNVTGTGPLNVTATIPASKAGGGKLFGRVKGVTP